MFDLFGAEMPLAVRFFLAFIIVLGLIGAAAWAVRRFGSARLGGMARGRQPRLGVIDYATVDARRRLILVRRDNVEHLLMIGGPTDVVVESNIVRAVPAARDVAAARTPSAAEALPRALALPEASNGSGGSWPLQPEAPTPPRRPRAEPIPEEPTAVGPSSGEPPPRSQREALTALADDLAAHPVPPVTPPPRQRAAAGTRPSPAPVSAEAAAADQTLAEMAQRLEAALRKPKAAEASAPAARPAPAPEHATETEAQSPAPTPAPQPPRPARPAEAKSARADSKAKEGKLYETLEQEMASLLGRSPGKTG